MKVFILLYHLAAAPTRYPLMIWNLLCSDHLLASAILLYHSNHSLGSSTSVPLNSVSLTWFDSLSTWFTPRFAPVSAFTNAATFGSNPPIFPPGGGLKPPPSPLPNPGGDNSGGLLLLLFLRGELLLLFPKAPNPPIRFAPTIPKCRKYPPPVFTLLVTLFCELLPPAVAPVVILVCWLVKLNIFGSVVVF